MSAELAELARVREAVRETEAELARKDDALSRADARLAETRARELALSRRLDAHRSQQVALHQAMRQLQARKRALADDIELARQASRATDRTRDHARAAADRALSAVHDILHENGRVTAAIARLRASTAELKKEKKALEDLIRWAAEKGIRIHPRPRPRELDTSPLIKGTVTDVKLRQFLCTIDAGRNYRVRVGQVFTVYRKNKYIGKVKVRKVFNNSSACQFLLDQMFPGRSIEKGDKVTTRYN